MLSPKEGAQACLAAAEEMVKAGNRRDAIALYVRARQLDPNQTQVCRILAVLFDQERMDKEAFAEYKLAVEQAPRDADLLNDLGYFYYTRHDLPNAEQWLRKAIGESPEHERAELQPTSSASSLTKAAPTPARSLCRRGSTRSASAAR
jgi:Tfp pilus assembly protein PilF